MDSVQVAQSNQALKSNQYELK